MGVLSQPDRLAPDEQIERQLVERNGRLAVAQRLSVEIFDRSGPEQAGHVAARSAEVAGQELVEARHVRGV